MSGFIPKQGFVSAFSSKTSTNQQKVALVTGATDGIGLTTAKNLSKMGYRVIVHGRDQQRIKNACELVNSFSSSKQTSSNAIPALADLSSISGCQQLISTIKSSLSTDLCNLDLIVHNAGVFADNKKIVGENDLEETFAVNVLAPFVLTSMMLPILTTNKEQNDTKGNNEKRIVIASSISQSSRISNWDDVAFYTKQSFSSHKTYSESKLLVAMLSYEMSERLKSKGLDYITVNCLDPGTVNTKMLLAGWGPCGIDVESALDETWLSTTKDMKGITGKYFVGRSERKSSRFAYDKQERHTFWQLLKTLAPEASAQW